MLNTWKYGLILIVDFSSISDFDVWLGDDCLGEWSYFYRPTHWGDVVAVHNWED